MEHRGDRVSWGRSRDHETRSKSAHTRAERKLFYTSSLFCDQAQVVRRPPRRGGRHRDRACGDLDMDTFALYRQCAHRQSCEHCEHSEHSAHSAQMREDPTSHGSHNTGRRTHAYPARLTSSVRRRPGPLRLKTAQNTLPPSTRFPPQGGTLRRSMLSPPRDFEGRGEPRRSSESPPEEPFRSSSDALRARAPSSHLLRRRPA